jgi:lipopolysaccharide biosynthesis protein
VLLEKITLQEINEYDSLVLCNDTFYGFFVPIEEIVREMDERKVDVWGLNTLERGLLNHISSYFLVFNRGKDLFENLINFF